MRRSIVLAVLCCFAAVSLSAGETRRYLVATKGRVVEGAAIRTRDAGDVVLDRGTVRFRELDGFAADLTDAQVAALKTSSDVRYVEPDVERHALNVSDRRSTLALRAAVSASTSQLVPYGVDLVRAREAWVGAQGEGINVVVIDTGIDVGHPELAAIYQGGHNTFNASSAPIDDNGHGTHVSGTIAAANNEIGVVGIAPKINLWAVKVLNSDGAGSTAGVISAMDWVMTQKRTRGGNWVVNLSLGSSSASVLEREAFQRAADLGILAIAASGNESSPSNIAPVGFPAAYDTVIAVGAVDSHRAIADFSNQGPELDLVAPGVQVLSTLRRGTGELSFVKDGEQTVYASALAGSGQGSVTAPIVYCGIGNPEEFPANMTGKIALIKRGVHQFALKARRAMARGAIGVIIFNHDETDLTWTLYSTEDPTPNVPFPVVVAVTLADGEALLAHEGQPMTVSSEADDYGVFNGTSMATPHVAGVAALVWSAAPNASATVVRNALIATAHDLGDSGFDFAFGNGVVDALDAAKLLAPGKYGSGQQPSSRRGRVVGRGR